MNKLFYTTIDELPIYNWQKICETGDLRYVFLKLKELPKSQSINAQKRWNLLYEEYISKFGFNEQYLEILEKEKEIALLIIQKNEKRDFSIQTLINLRRNELHKRQAEVPKGDFFVLKSQMEKELGFRIDIKNCSVTEFYSYLKTLQKK